MRSRTLLTVAASTLLAGLALTACSGSGGSTGSRAAAPAAAPSVPTSAAPSSAPAPGVSVAPVSAPGGAATAATCLTRDLKWSVLHVTEAGADEKDPANGELVAVNSGAHGCTLAGYPTLEFHLGKGPEALGVGKGTPAPVTLGAGRKAVIALHYAELNGKGPDSANCEMITADAAQVAAPGDGVMGRAPVLDRNGRPAQITICGDEVRMSPPVLR